MKEFVVELDDCGESIGGERLFDLAKLVPFAHLHVALPTNSELDLVRQAAMLVHARARTHTCTHPHMHTHTRSFIHTNLDDNSKDEVHEQKEVHQQAHYCVHREFPIILQQ